MQRARALVVIAVLALVPAARAAEPPCEFDHVDRIVAVGDVHGAYDQLMEILHTAGVIDARDRWAAGRTHLVQVGDMLDRGPDSRKVLDFYRRIEREAASAGGQVHVLIGNHEAMRILGDVRYVSAGEYRAFATSASETVRRDTADAAPPALREQLLHEPLGAIELLTAFASSSVYGAYLRGLNAVVRLNGILFVHGGISPAMSARRCADINATIRRELSAADLEKTKAAPDTSLVSREDGPLWYRGLVNEPDTIAPQVDLMLAAQQARAIVVGHTPQENGRVLVRFGGKVVAIDTGMLPGYVPNGRASALEIRGEVYAAIYGDRRDVIVGAAGRPTSARSSGSGR
jgi:hypothetical protein